MSAPQHQDFSGRLVLGGAVLVAALIVALAVWSFVKAGRPAVRAGAGTEPAAQAERSEGGGMAVLDPERPAPPPAAARPRGDAEYETDSKILRDRETSRLETIAALRQQARENPESGQSLSEDVLNEIERSGQSFR